MVNIHHFISSIERENPMTFVKLTFTDKKSMIEVDIVVPEYNIQEFYLHDITKAARYYRGQFV